MPGVGHHVRERAARAEARDSAALPAVGRPPVEQRPAHERHAQVARRSGVDRVSCRQDRRRRAADAGAWRQRGGPGDGAAGGLFESGDGSLTVGQVVDSASMSSGSHVSPAASRPVLRSSTHICNSIPYYVVTYTVIYELVYELFDIYYYITIFNAI